VSEREKEGKEGMEKKDLLRDYIKKTQMMEYE